MRAVILVIALFALMTLSCEEKKYLAADAIVVETKHIHWGKGYYNLDVYYRYYNGTDTTIGNSISKGKEEVHTARFIKGDSVRIGFNPNDRLDSYIIRKIYSMPRYKGGYYD